MSTAALAKSVGVHENTVRNCLRRFAQFGLRGLGHRGVGKPKNSGFTEAVRDEVARVAMHSPAAAGESFPEWSLRRLRDHVIGRGVVRRISVEGLRRLLSGLPLPTAYWHQAVHPGVVLTPEVRHALESMAEGPRSDRRLRAKIVLAGARGLNETEIAAALHAGKLTVRKWLRRFRRAGILGLQTAAQSPRLSEQQRRAILRIAGSDPRRYGHAAAAWSPRLLRETLAREGVFGRLGTEALRQLIEESASRGRSGEAAEGDAVPAVG